MQEYCNKRNSPVVVCRSTVEMRSIAVESCGWSANMYKNPVPFRSGRLYSSRELEDLLIYCSMRTTKSGGGSEEGVRETNVLLFNPKFVL